MPVDVASSADCEGGYPGLFDMMGNVVEWVDSCDSQGGATDSCYIRSSAFDDNNSTCSDKATQNRDSADNTKGFRCCAM